ALIDVLARELETDAARGPDDQRGGHDGAGPLRSGELERDGGGFAAADAERRHAALAALLAQRADQRDDQPRAGGADRMPQCEGAAVEVELLARDAVLLHGGHGDHRERLVDLEQVDVAWLPARGQVALPA